MKKLALGLILAVAAWQLLQRAWSPSPPVSSPATTESQPAARYDASQPPRSGERIEAEGVVVRMLPDDTQGSRHQRFIVRLPSGQTVLIAHNIDVAPRVEGLAEGEPVSFAGEYEPNDKGGVVHWTHHAPSGRHAAGWIRYRGRTYQ